MAEAERLEAKTGVTAGEAARTAKVSPSTVRARRTAKRAAGVGAQKGTRAPQKASATSANGSAKRGAIARPGGTSAESGGIPSSPPPGAAAKARKTILPQGGAVEDRPDLLALVREILDARNPRARVELDDGLVVFGRDGRAGLDAWKARPLEAVQLDGDELDVLRRGLALAVEVADRAEPGGPLLRALAAVEGLGKSVSVVAARRPPEPRPDEVQQAIRREMGSCVEHLLRHTRETSAAFETSRAKLFDGLDGLDGPTVRTVLRQRVEAMLGGAGA